jgi:EF hand
MCTGRICVLACHTCLTSSCTARCLRRGYAGDMRECPAIFPTIPGPDHHARCASELAILLTGRTTDADRLFKQYDQDLDGYLSPQEVYRGLETWGLHLQAETFSQFVDCNFLYADRDADGRLSQSEWCVRSKMDSLLSVLMSGSAPCASPWKGCWSAKHTLQKWHSIPVQGTAVQADERSVQEIPALRPGRVRFD